MGNNVEKTSDIVQVSSGDRENLEELCENWAKNVECVGKI
jgi:hypothetical protein